MKRCVAQIDSMSGAFVFVFVFVFLCTDVKDF